MGRHHRFCSLESDFCRLAGRQRLADETGRVRFSSGLRGMEGGSPNGDCYHGAVVSLGRLE